MSQIEHIYTTYLLQGLRTNLRWTRILRETSFPRRSLCVATNVQPGKFSDWNLTNQLPAKCTHETN